MSWHTLIDTETLSAHLHDPHWVVVDCRFELADPRAGQRDYERGHLPGARYAHLDRDLSAPVGPGTGRHPLPEPQRLAETFSAWGIEEGSQVVAYDAGPGQFAARLWWLLRWLGHRDVAVLDGGIGRWQKEGRALETDAAQPRAGRFLARPDRAAWLDADQVARIVHGEDSALIVDARSRPRYLGEQEPLDPAAGHVPGARNLPSMEHVAELGGFLPAARLRERFEALLGKRAPHEVVHMCGSGVTACHNLLAMEVAGFSGARVYPGSWSEWCRDPTRPVATGEESL